tara:strand:+ start:565 stop:1095 length:531 start_codon:yes stop_codon:yes gene_type:complete
MPATDQYTMVFKKNGKVITEANGGDVIDVELEGTFPVTLIQEKEIKNFNLEMENEEYSDIRFSNASYVPGSLTNAQGDRTATSDGLYLKSFQGLTRGLTAKIKFKIKLADSKISNKTVTLTARGDSQGFYFNAVANPAIEKSFTLNLKPKFNKWMVATVLAIIKKTTGSNYQFKQN